MVVVVWRGVVVVCRRDVVCVCVCVVVVVAGSHNGNGYVCMYVCNVVVVGMVDVVGMVGMVVIDSASAVVIFIANSRLQSMSSSRSRGSRRPG